ncbi:MAG: TIGR01777 family oxidoreductase [Anaerolineales bacterium]
MKVIIAGGTGLIGRQLTKELAKNDYAVIILSRNPEKVVSLPKGVEVVAWDGKSVQGWGELVNGSQAVVNLSGANIGGEGFLPSRLTETRKRAIRDSRILSGKALVEAIDSAEMKPEVFVQSSAVGYYGFHEDEILDESSPPGDDFFAEWKEWEKVSEPVEEMGVRRVIIRSGIYFSTRRGSALNRLVLPFKLFVGGPIGDGRQYFSWIHEVDETRALRFLIEHKEAQGPFNLTAPNPATDAEVGKTIAKVLNRPYYLPAPEFAFHLAFGEVGSLVTKGQRVMPQRLLDHGFEFQFPELEPALQDLLKN